MAQHASAGMAHGRANALEMPHPGMPSDAELVEALRLQLEAMLPPARNPTAPGGDIAAPMTEPEAEAAGEVLPLKAGAFGRPVASADGATPPDAEQSQTVHPTPDEATLSLLDELDRLWARGGA